MPEGSGPTSTVEPNAEVVDTDLSGRRFYKVQLRDSSFRRVDLSGAVLRDVSLAGASVFGSDIDGLNIDGIDVAPLIEAELTRRYPARALQRASEPAGLRTAWTQIQQSWSASYARAAALPEGSTDISVAGEWSYAQTLRHLVFATDAWLGGAILGLERPFHPWGVPFSEVEEFAGPPSELGVDVDAAPSYAEVLQLRADRVAKVSAYLSDVTPEQLSDECEAPVWDHGARLSRLRCLWVIFNEELEHLRFADRDLAVLEAGSELEARSS